MSAKTRKTLNRSPSDVRKKKTVKEQVLEENEGIIEQHKTEEEEYWCNACYFVNSQYHSGQWHNCKTHLTRNTHIEALKKYQARSAKNTEAKEKGINEEKEIRIFLKYKKTWELNQL